jgi:hypothetical protein
MQEASDLCDSLLQECHSNLSSKQFAMARQKAPHLLKKKIDI